MLPVRRKLPQRSLVLQHAKVRMASRTVVSHFELDDRSRVVAVHCQFFLEQLERDANVPVRGDGHVFKQVATAAATAAVTAVGASAAATDHCF